MVIFQGGWNNPACGVCKTNFQNFNMEHNRFLLELLEKRGGRDSFSYLAGDISIIDNLLFFPQPEDAPPHTEFFPARDEIKLPEPWDKVKTLKGKFHNKIIKKNRSGMFAGLVPGIYEMKE